MLLRANKSPTLAPSPSVPAKGHIDTVLNALRLYFVQLDSVVGSVVGRFGGRYLHTPHGSFASRTTQSVAAAATPTRVVLGVSDYEVGVTRTSAGGIQVSYAGRYNLQFSVQNTNTDTQAHDMDLWLRVDGVDVPWTASVATVPSTHGGLPGYSVLAANFILELQKGQYVELWWAASSTQVQLNSLPAITTPFVSPGSPSVVATLTFVSNLE